MAWLWLFCYQEAVYTRNVNVQGGYCSSYTLAGRLLSTSGQMETDPWHNSTITNPRRILHHLHNPAELHASLHLRLGPYGNGAVLGGASAKISEGH